MNIERELEYTNMNDIEENRKRRLLFMLLLMTISIHVILFVLSIFLKKPITLFLLSLNICFLFIYFIFWKRKRYTLVIQLLITSIVIHSSAASIILGWESYYSFYLFTGIIIIANSHSISSKIKIAESLIIFLLFLFIFFYSNDFQMTHKEYEAKEWIGITNLLTLIFSVFFMLTQNQKENRRLRKHLYEISEIDTLTGAYNRRFFNNYLSIEKKRLTSLIQYSGNETSNFGIAMVDLDDFKMINDNFGHITGDHVLSETARIMKESLFERDILCRYGGEEFVILYTSTDKEGALVAIEKIRKSIQQHRFVIDGKKLGREITVSIGFACFKEEKDLNKLLDLSDKRLYQAKKNGKNCIVAD